MTEIKYRKRKYVSVSTLLSFARCPRKYFYEKCGLSSEGLAVAPEFGSAMHKAIPVALITNDFDAAMAAFVSVWQDTEAKMADLEMEPDKKRNRSVAEHILKHFIHTHSGTKSIYRLVQYDLEGAIEMDEKTSDYEVPWALDIGLDIPLVGRFDSFCEHRDTGDPWVWELKTTSRLSSNFFDAHEMSPQNLVYSLVAQTLLEKEVQGMMVEGILVAATKVDNQVQPIPTEQHHLEDIMMWLRTVTHNLLQCEKLAEELKENEPVTLSDGTELGEAPRNPILAESHAFFKNFAGCTPYPFFYVPMWRCGFSDLCRVPDWTQVTDFYSVREEHDFFASALGPSVGETSTGSSDSPSD